jgi:hypothetical protein
MQPNRNRMLIAVASALLAWGACAKAAQPTDVSAPAAAVSSDAAPLDRPDPAATRISDATRALEQAALQADFASNERQLELLQQAFDDLTVAVHRLHGAQRARVDGLLADLSHAIERASAPIGPVASPLGDAVGPPPPSRNQLAQLAIEAQEVERQAPTVHRLVDGTLVASNANRASAGSPDDATANELNNQDPLSWPLRPERAWPQVHFQF